MREKAAISIVLALVLGLAPGLLAGQIGHWALDEGSGTTARDSSGNNNHGQLIGGPQWVNGILGGALQFDGVDDYVEVPHDARLIPTTGKATVAVWINAERHTGPGGSNWQGILAKGGAPRLYNLYTQVSGVLHFSTGPSGAYIGPLSTGQVPLNEWVHAAVVVDGRDYFYLNGEPAGVGGEGATVPTGGTAPLTIGQTGESNFFLGMIDDARLYDLALTPEQVKDLYNGYPPSWPKARNPNPPDGAVGVVSALFQWDPGDRALFHNVYLGTSPELTEADLVASNQPFNMYWHVPGLEPGVTYYWRVDEVEADMVTVNAGDVWSFTAVPTKAYAPNPADGAQRVPVDSELVWSPMTAAISHDVYFGTSADDVAAGTGDTFQGNQLTTTFDPRPLAAETVYYWRVDEFDLAGTVMTGDVWSFRTDVAISDPNLVGWWRLDEALGTTAADSSGYGNHGQLQGDPQWVPGYDGGAVELDGMDDYVQVPHDETLTADTEVTVMAWINTERHTGPGGAEWQGIVAKGNSPRSYSLYTYSPGTLHFSTAGGGGTSADPVPLNEWVHVAVAAGPSEHTYFINGEPAGQGGAATPPGIQDTAPVRIGATQEQQREFLGMIDDVRIYRVALTEDQIAEAMQGDPSLAHDPMPSAGAIVDIQQATSLSWLGGEIAAEHDVYFGTEVTAVAGADTSSAEYMGRQAGTSYPLAGLVEFGGGDYFWRIDEIEADGVTVHKGRVWMFTVADYLIVDDFESYTDDVGERIFQTWLDGWGYTEPEVVAGNGTGATVGYIEAPFAEQTIVHGGGQSMPFDYNNIISPWYSEAERTWATPQDWTGYGVTDLSLWIRGYPARFEEPEAGHYVIGSTSGDIWNNADHFRYVYKQLNGDGSITAKVHNMSDSAAWAKAGVMIRETLEAPSKHAFMFPTPDGRRAFQNRPASGGTSQSAHSAIGAITFPFWVKLERKGNDFTAFYSQDGVAWVQQPDDENTGADASPNPQTSFMTARTYIGLAVTSNNVNAPCIAEFSDVQTTGAVTGQWQVADIGGAIPGNDSDQLYVVVADSAGRTKVALHPDPDAVLATDWTQWKIPLDELTAAGVNVTAVKRMVIGVGDRNNPQPAGHGMLFIDDIQVTGP